MADYIGAVRTNYFHVKDEEAFTDLMSRVYGDEGEVSLWTGVDDEGEIVFAFGSYGGIDGVRNEDEDAVKYDEFDYDGFLKQLQKCVADDDAVIILNAGREGLRYVIGMATIVTTNSCQHIDMTYLAIDRAKQMLGNPEWNTNCEY